MKLNKQNKQVLGALALLVLITFMYCNSNGGFQLAIWGGNYRTVTESITLTTIINTNSPQPSPTPSPQTYTLRIMVNGEGTTSPLPGTYVYYHGDLAQVYATPSSGLIFWGWRIDGSDAGNANPIVLSMDKNMILTAYFTTGGAPVDDPLVVDSFLLFVESYWWLIVLLCGVIIVFYYMKRRGR